jgi:hypothetical protein
VNVKVPMKIYQGCYFKVVNHMAKDVRQLQLLISDYSSNGDSLLICQENCSQIDLYGFALVILC